MKFGYLALFLLFTTFANAQQIQLKGTVTDAQTGRPIASVTIKIHTFNAFYLTDKNGKFDITADKITLTDTLAFSCIGYQTNKIKVDSLLPNSIVKMSPAVNILNEVKVNNKPVTIIKVGSKRKTGY